MPTCPRCNGDVEPETDTCPHCEADLCPACGALANPYAIACGVCGEAWTLTCPRCDGEVAPTDTACPHCGFAFDSGPKVEAKAADTAIAEPESEPEPYDGSVCPECGTRVYVGDPFCATCGHPLCPRCGAAVEEEAERCPDCDLTLVFVCPNCGIELGVGAEVCPDCVPNLSVQVHS